MIDVSCPDCGDEHSFFEPGDRVVVLAPAKAGEVAHVVGLDLSLSYDSGGTVYRAITEADETINILSEAIELSMYQNEPLEEVPSV